MRNRISGRRWLFGRDRRRHRGELAVIGLSGQPGLYLPAARSRFRAWKILLTIAVLFIAIAVAQRALAFAALEAASR